MELVNSASIVNATDIDSIIGVTPAVKVVIIIWTLTVIIIGVGGNGLVLLGSIKYQALRMDRISIYLLECVAATDLILTCLFFGAILVTEIANAWILGEAYCFFVTVLMYVGYSIEIKLIAAIAIYRSMLLASPFSAIPQLSLGKKILFYAAIAGLECCFTSGIIFIKGYPAFFNPSMFSCDIDFIGSTASIIVAVWSVLIPGAVLVASNVFLLTKARRIGRSSNPQTKNATKGLKTVIILCWAFLLTFGPCCIMIGLGFTERGPPGWMFCAQNLALGLNLFVNPVIYTFTNARFYNFIKSMIGLE